MRRKEGREKGKKRERKEWKEGREEERRKEKRTKGRERERGKKRPARNKNHSETCSFLRTPSFTSPTLVWLGNSEIAPVNLVSPNSFPSGFHSAPLQASSDPVFPSPPSQETFRRPTFSPASPLLFPIPPCAVSEIWSSSFHSPRISFLWREHSLRRCPRPCSLLKVLMK